MRDQIVALIENDVVTHFITGMALGVDMYAAEIDNRYGKTVSDYYCSHKERTP